ncbi:TRAP transporter small permease [Pontibacterium granulatum]|uniref:TRAP transporter small permease n=1 Tax=Pontibacterium granulatum TaxID=2036029 RepID=UPI00249BFEEB|nr:TRAP transporter small permease [Pontibacterium granulatum]MDI3325100.1 TRAP transporter small permease [Pontibacterium granulatum]
MVKRIIDHFEESFLSLLMVSMTLLVFAEVVLRFGFNTGIHWAQEVTLLIAAWFVLYGASYGVKVGAHIGVDVFVKLLPSPIHRFLTLLAIVLALVYCGMFLYGSWIYLAKMKMIGIELEDLPVPKWIPMSVLVIGFALLALRFLELGWKVLKGDAEGFHFVDEAKESMEIAEELKEHTEADVAVSEATDDGKETK